MSIPAEEKPAADLYSPKGGLRDLSSIDPETVELARRALFIKLRSADADVKRIAADRLQLSILIKASLDRLSDLQRRRYASFKRPTFNEIIRDAREAYRKT